jgi:hypothetical protein
MHLSHWFLPPPCPNGHGAMLRQPPQWRDFFALRVAFDLLVCLAFLAVVGLFSMIGLTVLGFVAAIGLTLAAGFWLERFIIPFRCSSCGAQCTRSERAAQSTDGHA